MDVDGRRFAGDWRPLTRAVAPVPGVVDVIVARPAAGYIDEFERGRDRRLSDASARRRARRHRLQASARAALARYLGVEPPDLRLVRAPAGQPRLDGRRLVLSLSYADDLVLVAVSPDVRLGLGVDVERYDPDLRLDEVAAVACADQEASALAAVPEHASRQGRLLRMWTAKEAVLKAAGVGLRLDPVEVVTLVEDDRVAVQAVPASLGSADQWWLAAVDPTAEHVGTVAVAAGAVLGLRRWSA
jgi:4'-phosphopantetheinyl transferase